MDSTENQYFTEWTPSLNITITRWWYIMLQSRETIRAALNQLSSAGNTSLLYISILSAIKLLNFVRRNLWWICQVCCLLRFKNSYTSLVWGPHLSKEIQAVESVQRIAARCMAKSNYSWENNMTSMLSELQWPAIKH